MIALYASYYLIISMYDPAAGIATLPFQTLSECQAAAVQIVDKAEHEHGPSMRAFCIVGNKI